MTDIPTDLDLRSVGLRYLEMDPFATSIRADGRHVRFWRSIDATVASISEHDRAEGLAYRKLMDLAAPLVRAVLPAIRADKSVSASLRAGGQLIRAFRHQPAVLARDLLGPYGALLARRLPSNLTRAPIAAFAAHGTVGPDDAGGAIYGFWQAAYHLFGQWHPLGGAQALADALVRRLESLGGQVRRSQPVVAIETSAGQVVAVRTAGGERIPTGCVVAAIDPTATVNHLLDGPPDTMVSDLGGVRRGNVVQGVVHVATTALPPYPDARAEDHRGLQSYVTGLDDLRAGWNAAQAGRLPDHLPLYAFTPSALDATQAPDGHHTVYLACPTTPAEVTGGPARAPEPFRRNCARPTGRSRARLRRHRRIRLRLDPGSHERRRRLARGSPHARRPRPRPARTVPAHPGARLASHTDQRPLPLRGGHVTHGRDRRHPRSQAARAVLDDSRPARRGRIRPPRP